MRGHEVHAHTELDEKKSRSTPIELRVAGVEPVPGMSMMTMTIVMGLSLAEKKVRREEPEHHLG